MLWTSLLILIVLWLLALLLDVRGPVIHALPIVALVLLVARISRAGRA